MGTQLTVDKRRALYIRLYRSSPRASMYSTSDMERAINLYSNCDVGSKDYYRVLALTEIFRQLKFVLGRLDKGNYSTDDLIIGKVPKELSRALMESTNQFKKIQSYLNVFDAEIDIMRTVLEVY